MSPGPETAPAAEASPPTSDAAAASGHISGPASGPASGPTSGPTSGPAPATVSAAISAAVSILESGGVIGLPTETVYGLAGDAGQREAIASIYRIKGRPADHPLIVHVLDAASAARWAVWDGDGTDRRAAILASAFWPGPLTLVLPRQPGAPAWACAGETTIALRAPSHPLARAVLAAALARGVEGIAAPSANRYGRVSPTRAAHVREDLGEAVALVLDGGDCEVGIESTIVDLSGPETRVLRPGGLGAEAIFRALAEADPGHDPAGGDDATAVPRVPGDRRSHYAPTTPVVVIPAEQLASEIARRQRDGVRIAVWSRVAPLASAVADSRVDGQPRPALVWRERAGDPGRFAHELYEGLRALDRLDVDLIMIEAPPVLPAWTAINDRLTRASAP